MPVNAGYIQPPMNNGFIPQQPMYNQQPIYTQQPIINQNYNPSDLYARERGTIKTTNTTYKTDLRK
jgi:hypothetical protein